MTKMVSFRLTESASKNYFDLQTAFGKAQVEVDIEPTGKDIRIEIDPIFGCTAYIGNVELGEVIIEYS